jgi:hypothetical protein
MKINIGILVMGACLLALGSCSKGNGALSQAEEGLQGKWNLVVDSGMAEGPGIVYDIHDGTASDYWNFASNGELLIQEGDTSGTLGYILPTDNTVTVKAPSQSDGLWAGTYDILVLTPHQAVLYYNSLTPGITFIRKVYLTR